MQNETLAIAGKAAATILAVAEARAIDLIVICSHGHTGMKRQVLGSVAENVAHHSHVPLPLLREGGPMPSVTVDDDIAAGIIRVAEEGEVGRLGGATGGMVSGGSHLIAMATHGSAGAEQWAMWSVTERVLQATSLPLLIVRPANP